MLEWAPHPLSDDGWYAWRLEDGPVLDHLRQQLLKSVMEQAPRSEPVQWDLGGIAGAVGRFSDLSDARVRAENGEPDQLTVPDYRHRPASRF